MMRNRDHGPAWPWAWGIRYERGVGDGGMVVERWWSLGVEGQSRLDTALLAQVLRHPEFELRHAGNQEVAWPPRSLTLEPTGPRRVTAIAS